MRPIFLSLVLLSACATQAGMPPFKYSEAAAAKYAEGAMLEFRDSNPRMVDLAYLKVAPRLLAGVNPQGNKVVLALFVAGERHYFVCMSLDKDNHLKVGVHGVGEQSTAVVAAAFPKESICNSGL